MPPQPLSKVNATAAVYGSNTFGMRPQLAPYVMQVIGEWASIDASCARMLAHFLKADYEIGAAMFAAIVSGEGRKAALTAAAKAACPADNFLLFQAVMRTIGPSRMRRNEFAHYIWSYAPAIEDALLLIDPKAQLSHTVALRRYGETHRFLIRKTPDGGEEVEVAQMPDFDLGKVMVYREADLVEARDAAIRANGLVECLFGSIAYVPPYPQMRQALEDDPEVKAWMAKITANERPQTN